MYPFFTASINFNRVHTHTQPARCVNRVIKRFTLQYVHVDFVFHNDCRPFGLIAM